MLPAVPTRQRPLALPARQRVDEAVGQIRQIGLSLDERALTVWRCRSIRHMIKAAGLPGIKGIAGLLPAAQ